MENIASSTMTQKIDSTTDWVVRLADAFGAATDLQPLEAADGGDDEAEHRRLDHAGVEMPDPDRVAQSCEELRQGEVEIDRAGDRPAQQAGMSPQKASSGSDKDSAMMRGSTSHSIGFSPIVRMASTSRLTCIVPIWAVKALPERPATMIAVSSTPSSRTYGDGHRLDT